ncbi:DUF6153 family protein [Streptomyces sp. APSN-46.1]|uniref:DUF6153 family protein n=1 Tax=Streptomyces sp. APSN-46.1 TaxID=2929049 RepID=UPI001FB4520A|nr:DUF6153 family protein [Streptomyces sp. APSN-46.1]MCJ1679095.1 DUF6153 family protein [Streptomyces sp. APSN-46.1]
MSSAVLSPRRRPVGRGFVLLVLAVLVGVLAMHGLGPGPGPMKARAAGGGHGMVMAHEKAVHQVVGGCSHNDGGARHADHADATCAATGVGAPYVPPALASALGVTPAVAALPSSAAGVPESGRAPPDLAELQLLRI